MSDVRDVLQCDIPSPGPISINDDHHDNSQNYISHYRQPALVEYHPTEMSQFIKPDLLDLDRHRQLNGQLIFSGPSEEGYHFSVGLDERKVVHLDPSMFYLAFHFI